jgi:outer membrane protein TolC
MASRWRVAASLTAIVAASAGCRLLDDRLPNRAAAAPPLAVAMEQPPDPARDPALQQAQTDDAAPELPEALALQPPGAEAELAGLIGQALASNRAVQAARWRVLALRARVPQVTALEDPMVQNGVWPFPMNGPQYSLMGYMPYDLMISQQFPWLGTLRLRGVVAAEEAQAALWELAETQLEVAAEVKRAYADLRAAERRIQVIEANRELAQQIVELTRVRLETGGPQQDVLRAEVAVAGLDRDLVEQRREAATARAALVALLHLPPGSDLPLLFSTEIATPELPAPVEHLYAVAIEARPELRARLAEVSRDRAEVALARKRFYPDVTVGLAYNTMTRRNNPSPQADGRDNIGFVVGFNLPVYRHKYRAAVDEARAQERADALRYEAQRDQILQQLATAWAEVEAARETLALLRDRIAPKSRLALEGAVAGYRAGSLDYVTLNTAREELLAVELQLATTEAALARAAADLERAVGAELAQGD